MPVGGTPCPSEERHALRRKALCRRIGASFAAEACGKAAPYDKKAVFFACQAELSCYHKIMGVPCVGAFRRFFSAHPAPDV